MVVPLHTNKSDPFFCGLAKPAAMVLFLASSSYLNFPCVFFCHTSMGGKEGGGDAIKVYCGGDFLSWIRPHLSQSTQHWSLLCTAVFVLQVIQHIHRDVWRSPADTCLTFSTLHAASHTHALPSLCVDSVFTQTAL